MCAHKQVLNLLGRELLEPLYWSPSGNQHICLRVQGGGCMQGGCVRCVCQRIRPGTMGLRLVKAKERGVRRNTWALGIT